MLIVISVMIWIKAVSASSVSDFVADLGSHERCLASKALNLALIVVPFTVFILKFGLQFNLSAATAC